MKNIQLILSIILLISLKGFSQSVERQIEIKTLKEEEWLLYKDMVTQLKDNNKINKSDAGFLKSLSSDSFVAFEQTTDSIVNQHGKIDEENILFVFKISSVEDEYLMILTSHLGFCHMFKYNISEKELLRIQNRGRVVLSGSETIQIKEFHDSAINFYAENSYHKEGDWIKNFTLDLNSEIFAHSKNCRFIKNKEECTFLGQH